MIKLKSNIDLNNFPKIGDNIGSFIGWLGNPKHSAGEQLYFEITNDNNKEYSNLTISVFRNIVNDISFSIHFSDNPKEVIDFAMNFLPSDSVEIDVKEQHESAEGYTVPQAILFHSELIKTQGGYLNLYITQEDNYSSMTVSLGKNEELFD